MKLFSFAFSYQYYLCFIQNLYLALKVNRLYKYNSTIVAIFIFVGLLFLQACGGTKQKVEEDTNEGLITHKSDSLVRIVSQNGRKSYRFATPLMERYELAKDPYSEFRKGVKIITYKDSTNIEEGSLIADYAIFFEKQELWEAKGNVVATNQSGHVLETQQLFWDQRSHRIYSNIDSRITQGNDVLVGVGFESDEKMEEWEFRRPRGRLAVDIEPTQDSLRRDSVDYEEEVVIEAIPVVEPEYRAPQPTTTPAPKPATPTQKPSMPDEPRSKTLDPDIKKEPVAQDEMREIEHLD